MASLHTRLQATVREGSAVPVPVPVSIPNPPNRGDIIWGATASAQSTPADANQLDLNPKIRAVFEVHFHLALDNPDVPFLDLGIDSLELRMLVEGLSEVLGLNLALQTFFVYPTLRGLASFLAPFAQTESKAPPSLALESHETNAENISAGGDRQITAGASLKSMLPNSQSAADNRDYTFRSMVAT
eukprot:9490487-Pyramimonas_sp.AAC.1